MKTAVVTNRFEVIGAERKLKIEGDYHVSSIHSDLYLNVKSKQAMLFERIEGGVRVSMSETNKEAIELIDIIQGEVGADGGFIEEIMWNKL